MRGFGKGPEVAFHALSLFPAVLVGQMLRGLCGDKETPSLGALDTASCGPLLGPDSADILASPVDASALVVRQTQRRRPPHHRSKPHKRALCGVGG